jgi:large subunit ribosomal protein L4
MKVNVYNVDKEVEESAVEIKLGQLKQEFNEDHVVYLVSKYQAAKKRAGTASTKTRSTVSGGGAKPYKQKGTGRARRGTSRSPLRRGGAVAHGPQPRSFEHKLNSKLVKNAFASVFSKKESSTVLINYNQNALLKASTLEKFLGSKNNPQRVVVIVDNTESPLFKAARNINQCRCFAVNSVDLEDLFNSDLVLLDSATVNAFERFN